MSGPVPEGTPAVADAGLTQPPSVQGHSPAGLQEPQTATVDHNCLTGERCLGCGGTSSRNLVVCIDGTSNQIGAKSTNVAEIFSRLSRDEHQLSFYSSGIGTYAKPSWKSWSYVKRVVANKLDLAFALRFEKIIIAAYAWLVDNYQEGDRIFLFGFSRGAYQVRALAAMIDVVGLLRKGNIAQIPFAYELYAASANVPRRPYACSNIRQLCERIRQAWQGRSPRDGSSSPRSFPWPKYHRGNQDVDEDHWQALCNFKYTISRPCRVHFVGVWDTVSSVGFMRDKTLPSTTDGMNTVCFFRHALALHEFRVKFLPEYVNGCAGPSREDNRLWDDGEPHTKEVWFTGSHSDIGGINATSRFGFGPALRWMSREAELAGLRLLEDPFEWVSGPTYVSKSMKTIWPIFECLPIKRLSYPVYGPSEGAPAEQCFTRLPHFFAHRQIQPFQRIHESVYEECLSFTEPAGVMPEADAYLILQPPQSVLRYGKVLNQQSIRFVQHMTVSKAGIQSLDRYNITKYIYETAKLVRNSPQDTEHLVSEYYSQDTPWRRELHDSQQATRRIMDDLSKLHCAYVRSRFRVDQNINLPYATDVTGTTSSETFPYHLYGHTDVVSFVSFLSNMRLLSGSWDETMRVWNVSTGEMHLDSPFRGHSEPIYSATGCTGGGHVASVSHRPIIRLWMSDSNGVVRAGKTIRDDGSDVYAVSFSPDGAQVVSGSADGAIRVWDCTTGDRIAKSARRHASCVRAVAVSSDGRQIVSASDDGAIQLWQWSSCDATLRAFGEPLNGHTEAVCSVAIGEVSAIDSEADSQPDSRG